MEVWDKCIVDGWASEINTGSVKAQHRDLQGWTYGLNTGGLRVSILSHVVVQCWSLTIL
jgi:hypothetical protein